MMKKIFGLLAVALFVSTLTAFSQTESEGKVIVMTTDSFKEKVFNYEKHPENWVFEGERPCIIDFYADWCRPCKMVAPIMDELAEKYKGKVDFYKVNTDKNRELSSVFGIRSIPSVLFCPGEGKPQMATGALPKDSYIKTIDEFLLGKKPKEDKKEDKKEEKK
jgi:thioredoxin